MENIFTFLRRGKSWISNRLDVLFHVIFWYAILAICFAILYIHYFLGTPSNDFELIFIIIQGAGSLMYFIILEAGVAENHFWGFFLIPIWIMVFFAIIIGVILWCIKKINELLDS